MAKRTLLSLLPKKSRPWVAVAIIALVVLGQLFGWFDSSQQPPTQSEPSQYPVVRFVDGDTIVVSVEGRQETIRMIGVDTPETHDPDTPVQCYGPAASAYTKNLIGDQSVRLETDPTNDDRDRYDRLLRYVYLPDGRSVAKEIISSGYGFAYTMYPFTQKEQYVAAEAQARAQAKGLWANCDVTEQGSRKQTTPLR